MQIMLLRERTMLREPPYSRNKVRLVTFTFICPRTICSKSAGELFQTSHLLTS